MMTTTDSIAHRDGVGREPRILVVDDNVDAANSLGRLLTLLGKEVRVAHDGPAALVEVERFHPHVILLDLGMPGMNGIETARLIRAHPEWGEVMLVALTGWGQDQDRQRTDAAGFVAHLVKPVNLEQLESVLADFLPNSQKDGGIPAGQPSSR
jgi:CheY-like chemotaxis protein